MLSTIKTKSEAMMLLTLLKVVFSMKISDPEKCDMMYESLARINSNMYKEKVSLKFKCNSLF